MPTFRYQGRESNGNTVDGELKANTIDDVVSFLVKRNIIPLQIDKTKEHGNVALDFLVKVGLNKVDPRDVLGFCRQLAVLNNAGVPMVKAITQLAQSAKNPIFKKALATIGEDIFAGQTLSNALRKHPDLFPTIVTNVIDIGENTGHLNEALTQIGNYLETSIANKRRLVSAIRYPMFVIVSVLGAMIMMNFFVIPKFTGIFSRFSIELPLPTRILMGTSDFMVTHWVLLLVLALIAFFGGSRLLKTPGVHYLWDRYKLFLPIVGNLQKRIILAQFSWTFSLILRSGVPVIKGIILAGNSTGNTFFSKEIINIGASIEQGETFSKAANRSGLFLPSAIQMIEVGEESGRLDEMLGEVAKLYEGEIDYDLRRINELIEPILLAIIGALVLLLALGIYFPMWDMIKVANV